MQSEDQSKLSDLDTLLSASDADSMIWTDGCESEFDEALLAQLKPAERELLFRSAAQKPTSWRSALVSILNPVQADEGQMLIEAIWDGDAEIAFSALCRAAYYCGVSSSRKRGVHEDPRNRIPQFLKALADRDGLAARIEKISSGCHPEFTEHFRLLSNVVTQG